MLAVLWAPEMKSKINCSLDSREEEKVRCCLGSRWEDLGWVFSGLQGEEQVR